MMIYTEKQRDFKKIIETLEIEFSQSLSNLTIDTAIIDMICGYMDETNEYKKSI
jgi:hypothetical protein